MIHRKKNRPALQRRDILTVSLASFFFGGGGGGGGGSVSILAISRAVLIYLFLFRVCSKAFRSLVILLISAIQRTHFSYSSQGVFVGLSLPRISF